MRRAQVLVRVVSRRPLLPLMLSPMPPPLLPRLAELSWLGTAPAVSCDSPPALPLATTAQQGALTRWLRAGLAGATVGWSPGRLAQGQPLASAHSIGMVVSCVHAIELRKCKRTLRVALTRP